MVYQLIIEKECQHNNIVQCSYYKFVLPMINPSKAIYKDWFQTHNWETCKLNNENYGKYLSSYLRSQTHPLVLNINGHWGTGKTHFLKQLYTDLLNDNNYACVYIDAWKSDFSNDPLLVIISELLDQLNIIHEGHSGVSDSLLKNLGSFAQKSWNFSVDVGAAYLANKFNQVDATATQGMTNHFKFGEPEPQIGKSLKDGYTKQLAAITNTQKSLTAYAQSLPKEKQKVFILIDELDRCRPTYAIETLETIKHFFNIPNFTFVVATDTEQLSHSISAVYGANFNGKEYLSRFFNRSAQLSEPDKALFVLSVLSNYKIGSKHLSETIIDNQLFPRVLTGTPPDEQTLANVIADVCSLYNLSLRKTEQVIAKFQSIVAFNSESNPDEIYDFLALLVLIAEREVPEYEKVYQHRKNTSYSHGTLAIPDKVLSGVATSAKWEQYLVHAARGLKVISANHLTLANAFSCLHEDINRILLNVNSISTQSETKQMIYATQRLDDHYMRNESMLPHINSYTEGLRQCEDSKSYWTKERYFEAVELSEKLS